MVFSIPSFLGVGDDYDKKNVADQRTRGLRTFLVSGPKTGNGADAMLDKNFVSIHAGDRYVDQSAIERKYQKERAALGIAQPTPFKFTNAAPKACGLGDIYTVMGERFPHETDYVVQMRGTAPPRREPARRGVFTAPGKKGTFGVPGTLLSTEGADYVASFYDAPQRLAREERARLKAAERGVPFKPSAKLGRALDAYPSTGISACYTMDRPMPPKRQFQSTAAENRRKPEASWRPAGKVAPPAPVEYREDPYLGYDPRTQSKKRDLSNLKKFTPAGATNTSWYTSSIAFRRL
jgi:hypothetical protein